MKKIVAVIVGMFLISLVSAITLTSGETHTFELDEPYEYYSIVGNSSEVDLNITQEGNNITISVGKYSPSDEFDIIFFNKEKEVIYKSSGGSGGTKTIYKDRNNTEYIEVEKIVEVEKDEEEKTPEEKEAGGIEKVIFGLNLVVVFMVALIMIIIMIRIRERNSLLKNSENEKAKGAGK